jgi:hypothetical protein
MPAQKVQWDNPEHGPFVGMVDWILQLLNPMVVVISAPKFLIQTCPGGMEYLWSHGFGFEGAPARVRVRDFSSYWAYRDPSSGAIIRSLANLDRAIEQWFGLEANGGNGDLFLLVSGDPRIGNSLVDIWLDRFPTQVRIHACRSPVDMAGDLVEKRLGLKNLSIKRHYLSGPQVIASSEAELEAFAGLILLMSIDDEYRRSSQDPSLGTEVFRRLSQCYGPDTEVFAFHAGFATDVSFSSTLGRIEVELRRAEAQQHLSYTFVIHR